MSSISYLQIILVLVSFKCVTSESDQVTNKTKPWEFKSDTHFPSLLYQDQRKVWNFNISFESQPVMIAVASSKPDIAKLVDDVLFTIPNDNNRHNISVTIVGEFIGRTRLQFFANESFPQSTRMDPDIAVVNDSSNIRWYLLEEYEVVVSREDTALNTSVIIVVAILVGLVNVSMGCKTDLEVVKKTLKRPIAPVTGLCSQFVLMPLISFGFGKLMQFEPGMAFGMFAMGCSPGGSASNMYTYFLGGDVSLSITMTFCSVLISLGMLPLWLYTLGVMVIYEDSDIHLPFQNLLTSLLILILPVAIGILLQKKREKWAKIYVKAMTPLLVIFVLFVFTVGVYANLYIFQLLTAKVFLSASLIIFLGLLFGGVVAFLARQSWKNIKTIAIETGIQDFGIAIVLLQLSLPPPDSDISIVSPIIGAIFTPALLVTVIIVRGIYIKWFEKKDVVEEDAKIENKKSENTVQNVNHAMEVSCEKIENKKLENTISNENKNTMEVSYEQNNGGASVDQKQSTRL
ncbi:hypothetical protein ScPMuIL_000661 [Solemya velum]